MKVWGSVFGVQGRHAAECAFGVGCLGFRNWGLGIRVWFSVFGVQGLGRRVAGCAFGVECSGFRDQGLGCGVQY
jgi:hypothetical protein